MYFMKVIQNQNSRRALHARLVVWFVSLPLSLLISPNLQMNYTNWKKLQIKYKFHHPSSSDPITIFSLDTLTPPRVVDLGLVPVDHDGGVGHLVHLDLGDDPLLEVVPLFVWPPGGGAPDDEPPPSVVLATLTSTPIVLHRIVCWFNFGFSFI